MSYINNDEIFLNLIFKSYLQAFLKGHKSVKEIIVWKFNLHKEWTFLFFSAEMNHNNENVYSIVEYIGCHPECIHLKKILEV